uniref:Amiloride-sensitive sodium channel n=1 Tax=Parascaris equorum TaxID=6256 RepID=A0A914RGD6_PAREQ
ILIGFSCPRQSTFHGISHAALAPNTKWRVIWYTAFFVCLIALLIQIILLIRRYRTYAKTVDLDFYPTKAHCCKIQEAVKKSEVIYEHLGSKQREKRETLNETRIRRYHQVYAQCICEVNALSGERKKGSCFAAYKGNISITFMPLNFYGNPMHNSRWLVMPNFSEIIDLGHCPMRFYEGKQRDHSSYGEMDVCLCHTEYNHCIANNENGYIIEIDPHMDVSSLRVLLYANVTEYLPTSESVGFRITVHDKWIVPFPDAFGYSAPTGFLSSFGVRMKQFNRIPAPHGQCLDGGEDSPDFIYKGFNYSVEGCHRSCTQKEVIRLCGCADPMYPIPEGAKSCKVSDPVARECIKNTSHHLGRLIAEGHVPNCVCHQPCHETNYEVTYSSARWPSGTTKIMECEVNDDLCMERYRKNAAMLQIFYEELNYETLTEAPAYTVSLQIA